MITKEERDLILNMLASGKITAAEARDLFDAIERSAEEQQTPEVWDEPESILDWAHNLSDEINNELRDHFQHIAETAAMPFIHVG